MGAFRYNSTGIDLDKSYDLIPDGWYPFKIVEAEVSESKSGYPMILAKCRCLDPRHSNKGLLWHYVVFLPKGQKGDGMNVHFRKSIGVPWEGDVLVDSEEWEGKSFMGKVVTSEYDGKKSNKFKQVGPIKDVNEPPAESGIVEDSDIQF